MLVIAKKSIKVSLYFRKYRKKALKPYIRSGFYRFVKVDFFTENECFSEVQKGPQSPENKAFLTKKKEPISQFL